MYLFYSPSQSHYYRFGFLQLFILMEEKYKSGAILSEHFIGSENWTNTIGDEFESWVRQSSQF
jgi:hypothetical protein